MAISNLNRSLCTGLVLRRALERFNLIALGQDSYQFDWCRKPYQLVRRNQDWHLSSTVGHSLCFLPIAFFGEYDESFAPFSPTNVLCLPSAGSHNWHKQCLGISPLDLYVVERVSQFIERWLLEPLLINFATPIGPFSAGVKALIDSWIEFQSVSKTGSILIAPLADDKQVVLMERLATVNASDDLTEKLSCALSAIKQLVTCHCGKLAKLSWNAHRPKDFYCQCDECFSTWSLTTIDQKRQYSMKPKEGKGLTNSSGFLWAGCDWLTFDV